MGESNPRPGGLDAIIRLSQGHGAAAEEQARQQASSGEGTGGTGPASEGSRLPLTQGRRQAKASRRARALGLDSSLKQRRVVYCNRWGVC